MMPVTVPALAETLAVAVAPLAPGVTSAIDTEGVAAYPDPAFVTVMPETTPVSAAVAVAPAALAVASDTVTLGTSAAV